MKRRSMNRREFLRRGVGVAGAKALAPLAVFSIAPPDPYGLLEWARPSPTAYNGYNTTPNWSHKTPDEILADVNEILLTMSDLNLLHSTLLRSGPPVR